MVFNMEGTEAVNTSQTNGSPFDDAAKQAGQVSADNGNSNHVIRQNAGDSTCTDENEQTAPAKESSAAVPPSQPVVNGSVAKLDDATQSVAETSVIQRSSGQVPSPAKNCVDGVVDGVIEMEPHAHEAIEFCVTCPGAPVRRLRLTGDRYTFGSAKGCSIRLSDETLRPMHAVLLCDASRIIVRAYSVPVEVNATRTTEANLGVGDILRLGQYQFELLSVKPIRIFPNSEACDENHRAPAAGDGVIDSNRNESCIHATKDERERETECCSELASLNIDADDSPLEYVQWRDLLSREVDQWREQFKSLSAQMEQLSRQQLGSVAGEETPQLSFSEDDDDLTLQNLAEYRDREVIFEQTSEIFEEQCTHSQNSHQTTDLEPSTLLSELEAAEGLRRQVEELQQIVADARSESEMLREDCEQASSSVRQLEQLVSESETRDGEQREEWITETHELKSSFEKLCTEMDQANFELNELRLANEKVSQRLDEVKQERDQARSRLEASPSQQEVDSLRKQLELATERVGNLQLDHEKTLVRLEATEQRGDGLKRSDEPRLHQADAVWEEVGNVGIDVSAADALQELGQQAAEYPTGDANEKERGQAGSDCTRDSEGDSEGDLRQADDDADLMTSMSLQEQGHEANSTSVSLAKSQIDFEDFVNLVHSDHETEALGPHAHVTTDSVGHAAAVEGGQEECDHHAKTRDRSGSSVCDAMNKLGEADIEGADIEDADIEDADIEDADLVADGLNCLGTDQKIAPNCEADVVGQNEAADCGLGDNGVVPEESLPDNLDGSDLSLDSLFLDGQLASGPERAESIEAYMNRLLEHVRGNVEETNVNGEGSVELSVNPEHGFESTGPNPSVGVGPLALEHCPDVDGMRELANASARVVDSCNLRARVHHLKMKAVVRLACAFGAISVGVVCYTVLAGFPSYVAFAMTSLLAVAYVLEARKLNEEASRQSATSETGAQEEINITVGNEQ